MKEWIFPIKAQARMIRLYQKVSKNSSIEQNVKNQLMVVFYADDQIQEKLIAPRRDLHVSKRNLSANQDRSY